MVEVGIVHENARLELLEGDLIEMAPQSPNHASTTSWLAECLRGAFGFATHLRLHSPVMLDDYSAPEPDVVVVKGNALDYRDRHPLPADIVLIAEVARTSVARDTYKVGLYARAGVPEVWIVDLGAGRLRRYREPDTALGEYKRTESLTNTDVVEVGDNQVHVALSQIL